VSARRVLLVEDEDGLRALEQLSLERVGGLQVVAVDSGSAALAAVAEEPSFDAILLDVMMPGLDGPATLSRLRTTETAAEVPVVFLTASSQPADYERLVALGAAGLIAKPFDPMRLPAELGELLGWS
jgi:two-component system OmpR family response regulator